MSHFPLRDRDPMSPPEHSNPWTTLSRRPIYENPWIALREDQVLRPDGQPGIYGVVHFKFRAIGVLPVDDRGRIWLVGQYRYTLDQYSWEIPEGGGHRDETPEEAARRELREETGLVAGHLELLGTSHLSNSVTDELGYIFRATRLEPGLSAPEGTERLQVRRVAWDEAWAMLRRGEITDSMSVIALLHEAVRRAGEPAGPQEMALA
ncbi:MAG: NUDIX hydrolase [Planctomycetaceae bacterium]|nr:NUDIX hydrolase [Planctomycetaceae bacterium]MBV8265325.1 NUDIX hydrolase [Planctomycetaceae bacterium]MBV8313778.1 NUDIX hydrolase [Planctomycetaceae bacterium]MBV8381210.1 NUDIX hydrolase [Planctomycetaceae bacterium]MBV8556685.1 NUDIX hydrolase [Planctomycetaceae bacterium]